LQNAFTSINTCDEIFEAVWEWKWKLTRYQDKYKTPQPEKGKDHGSSSLNTDHRDKHHEVKNKGKRQLFLRPVDYNKSITIVNDVVNDLKRQESDEPDKENECMQQREGDK